MSSIPRNWRGIEHVTVEQLVQYLVAHRWRQIEYHNNRLLVFQRSEDGALFALPAYPSLSDFYPRMMEAIDRIADEENEVTYVVLQRFASPGATQDIKSALAEVKRQLLFAHQSDTPAEQLEATILYIDNLLRKDYGKTHDN